MNFTDILVVILEEILSLAASATTGQVQNILNILERLVVVAAQSAKDLLPSIQGIIAALQGNGNVTPDQVIQLQAQSAIVDAALDAAAADDNLTP